MPVYTVCGLADELNGRLYVAEVYAGTPRPLSLTAVTQVPGAGALTRFTGRFDAESAGEAEQVAVDVVTHFRDPDTGYRVVATVNVEGDRL